jgi:hypothetical protein
MARKLGFVAAEAAGLSFTLTLAPEMEVGLALRQVAGAIAEFDGSSAPRRVRAVVHYGVVFRTESRGKISYLGSAIRSTQSALRRALESGSLMATRDFSTYASTLSGLPFSLNAINGATADGMSHVVFGGGAAVRLAAENHPPIADPAFVEFVRRRLAEDIGPFAGILVDRAIRSATPATHMATVLSREIDAPDARARFESDVLGYIKSHGNN